MRTIVFALAISLGCAVFATAQTASSPELAKAMDVIKRSVVAVVCQVNTKDDASLLVSIEGTGFFVDNDGTFVTAAHVAQGLFSIPRIPACPNPAVYVPKRDWSAWTDISDVRWFGIDKCNWNSDYDVAKCTLRKNPFSDPEIKTKLLTVTVDNSPQADGIVVAFTGFPLSFVKPTTSQGILATYTGTGRYGPALIVIDKNAWPGASGSPVYRADGKVIGMILQRGVNEAAGLAFARPSQYIIGYLAERKYAEQAEEEKKNTNPSPPEKK